MSMTNIDGKWKTLENPHVYTYNTKIIHYNTRETGTKMVENTLSSQIDKILKIVPRLDEYI